MLRAHHTALLIESLLGRQGWNCCEIGLIKAYIQHLQSDTSSHERICSMIKMSYTLSDTDTIMADFSPALTFDFIDPDDVGYNQKLSGAMVQKHHLGDQVQMLATIISTYMTDMLMSHDGLGITYNSIPIVLLQNMNYNVKNKLWLKIDIRDLQQWAVKDLEMYREKSRTHKEKNVCDTVVLAACAIGFTIFVTEVCKL